MKPNLLACFILALLAVALSSCETMFDKIFEKEADYDYLIHNGGTETIYVEIAAKATPSSIIYGVPKYKCTIGPGTTQEVWSTSGLTGEYVFDEEKGNTELYWFEIVSAVREGMRAGKFLNDPGWWVFKKEKNYKATYTLTLSNSDF